MSRVPVVDGSRVLQDLRLSRSARHASDRPVMHVALTKLHREPARGHEVIVIVQNHKAVMGCSRANLQVDNGQCLVRTSLGGPALQTADPLRSALRNGDVLIESIEHRTERLVLPQAPRRTEELRPLRVARSHVTVLNRRPPCQMKLFIPEHAPECCGVQQVAGQGDGTSFSARCAASAPSTSQSCASWKYLS